jgi:hypothetical protein
MDSPDSNSSANSDSKNKNRIKEESSAYMSSDEENKKIKTKDSSDDDEKQNSPMMNKRKFEIPKTVEELEKMLKQPGEFEFDEEGSENVNYSVLDEIDGLKEFSKEIEELKSEQTKTKEENKYIKKLPKSFIMEKWKEVKKYLDCDKFSKIYEKYKDKELNDEDREQFKKQIDEQNVVIDRTMLNQLFYFQKISMNFEGTELYFNSPNDRAIFTFKINENKCKNLYFFF